LFYWRLDRRLKKRCHAILPKTNKQDVSFINSV
jgi:hypothetical protein